MASFPFLIVLATFKILGHYCRANGTLFRRSTRSHVYTYTHTYTHTYVFPWKFLRRITVTDYAAAAACDELRAAISTIFPYFPVLYLISALPSLSLRIYFSLLSH